MKNYFLPGIAAIAGLVAMASPVFQPEPSASIKRESSDSLATMVANVRAMQRPFSGVSSPKFTIPKAPAAVSAETPLLYGGVLYADSWTTSNAPYGIYSSTLAKPLEVNPHYIGSMFTVQGGGFYNEGKYYFINYEIRSFDGEEYVYTTLYECTTMPFKQVASYSLGMSNIARDLTFDPIEQKVYGIFSVGNLEASYLIGRMNLNPESNDFRVTDLVYLDDSTNQVAIASDAKGTIYTIGVDGMLNRLDKDEKCLVPIGSTGVRNIEVLYPQSATIDLETGTFYWAALKTDGSSALYTVNTSTGRATKVDSFPDNEEFAGIYVPYLPAQGAPAAVAELFPDFQDGSLSGFVAFDAPKVSVGGSTLSGDLNYYLSVNGDEYYSGTVRAGRRNEEIEMNLPDNGWYTFSLVTENSAGRSIPKSLRTFIGKDAPVACPNPSATNAERDPQISIKWGKPRKGINGGFVDTLNVTYDVVRMPDNVPVATALTDTVCSDHIDNPDLHTYYYVITPKHEGIAGIPAATNKVAVGYIAQVPYLENFDTDVDFSTYTVVHASSAPLTSPSGWGTWNHTGYKGGVAQSSPIDGNAKDDWLFTPPVHLEPTRTYRLSYKAMSQGNSVVPSFIEHMEVKMGNAPTVDAMKTMLTEDFAVLNVYGSFLDCEATIHVEQEGEYHIGFHATTPAANLMWMLNIDDVSIEPGAEIDGPARVTDFEVTALPKGELGAVISFNAPNRTISNQPIETLDRVEILRGEQVIKTFTEVAGGSPIEYTDAEAAQGINEYTVVAYAEGNKGLTDKRSVFVGFDLPGEVADVRLRDDNGVPTVTWSAPGEAGPNGHYVDQAALKYTVERYFSARDRQVLAEGISELSFADTELSRPDQAPVTYIITPENHIGKGEDVYSNSIFVGDALSQLPLRESFPQCLSTSVLAYLSRSEGASWGVLASDNNITPYDNDGGMAVFGLDTNADIPAEGYSCMLYTNRFDIQGSVNPSVSFYYYNIPGSSNTVSLMVNVESEGWTELATYSIGQPGSAGWVHVEESLADFAGCRYIQIGFKGTAHDATYLYLDNILFDDMLDHNLQISTISVPAIMEVGQTVHMETDVTNRGSKDAVDYEVIFYRNDIPMASVAGSRLAPGMTAKVGHDFIVDIDCEQQNDIYAKVDYPVDMKPGDNETPVVSVFVDLPRLAYVDDLSGDSSDSGQVRLHWSAPDPASAQPEPVTDGFDEYSPFIINGVGEWTLWDGDAQPTWGISSGVSGQILQYPHAGEAMAWQVFNPVNAGLSLDYKPELDPSGMTYPDWRPRSGSQMLGSFSPKSGRADDWLVSPALTGGVQLVKFYARSIMNLYPETFEVLISDQDAPTVESFTRVGTYTVGMTWTPVATVVPEGTKYLAIRCISYGQFALMVDDITYAPADAMPMDASLKGFNVYVDGTRITPQPISALEYTIPADNAPHRYGVTAVYDLGESRMSNVVTFTLTGLNESYIDGSFNVKRVDDGILISTDGPTDVMVCDAAGTMVWGGQVTGVKRVNLSSGVYMVIPSSDSHTVKVIIR